MRAHRYTVLIADRSSGVLRRVTVNLRVALSAAMGVLLLPILIGLGARWSARAEIKQLTAANSLLQMENASYRTATGALTGQIQTLEGTIDELVSHASVDPAAARAMQKLPAIVKSRAAGGNSSPKAAISGLVATSPSSPEDTFGVIRTLLQGLENSLRYVRR